MSSSQAPWFLLHWAQQLGCYDVFRIKIPDFHHYTFVVGDPLLARDILTDPICGINKPFRVYRSAEAMTGASNIFSSNGERWRHARKAIAPAFSSRHIDRMNQVCSIQLERWIQNRLEQVFVANHQTFDPAQEMIALTLSIICEAAFEYDMQPEEATYFVTELEQAMREYMQRQLYNPFRKTWLGQWLFYFQIKRGKLAAERVRAIAKRILESYHQRNLPKTIINNNANDSTHNNNINQSRGTVIECIHRNDQYKNDEERIADILVFLVAGHDTTAYALAWTLLEMARHPDEVDRARSELLQMAAPEQRRSSTRVRNLIREAMRLHPVAALASMRQVHRDVVVNSNNNNKNNNEPKITIIPKGSSVLSCQLIQNLNPKYFHQPEVFLPERWNNHHHNNSNHGNNFTNISPSASWFHPFSLGPRNCIGQALADAELQTVVSRLIMDYDFQVVNPGHADFFLTLKPQGVALKAVKRSQHQKN